MKNKALLTLLALTTFLPEMFTGSTPITAFLNPFTLFFLAIGYGLAVLLIRELAVRHQIGLSGLVFFGVAYGLLNEGLFAKTLIMQNHLPVAQYDNYGVVFGFSLPWTLSITVWHAFASVVFPIFLTHYFYPDTSRKPYLRSRTAVLWSIGLMLFACAAFLQTSPRGITGTPAQLAVLLTAMLLLFVMGFKVRGNSLANSGKVSGKPVLLGVSILVPFLLLAAVAGAKVSPPLFPLIFLVFFTSYVGILRRINGIALPSFLCFAIGWYLHNIAMSLLLLSFSNPALAILHAIVDTLIVLLLWQNIRKRRPAGV